MLVGQFRPRWRLGEALYGPVGLFEDASHENELVAIKQVSLARAVGALRLNPHLDNPWSERRVVARLMALPPHPNVVRFRDEFLQDQATWCVVMEYCDGGDLWDLLDMAPGNRLPERQALALFSQCVRGVRFLHANDIAHRDLSLENVLCRSGVCKIGDFGLSTEHGRRTCGERVGKAYYMAPEVVTQQQYDPMAADMWSLGIMLFIMLTGSPLTASASMTNKAFCAFCRLGVGRVIEAWGMSDRVSPGTVNLLESLLSIKPAERLTSEEVSRMFPGPL